MSKKSVNFRVIENDYDDESNYDNFIREYNKGTQMSDIQSKLGLSNYMYCKYRKIALKSGKIHNRKTNNAKYYYYVNGNWLISKWDSKSKKRVYYGRFKTKEEAIKRVEELKKNNWDKLAFPYNGRSNMKYYYPMNDGWVVLKWDSSVKKSKYYGKFKTEEEAIKRVEELKKNNWIL